MDDQAFILLVADIKDLRKDIVQLREDIKSLNAFKWKVFGMVSVITFGLNILINLYKG